MHKHFCFPIWRSMIHTYTPSIHPPKNLGSEEINKTCQVTWSTTKNNSLTSLNPKKPPHVKPSTSQACRSTVSHEDFNARSCLVPPIAATTCAWEAALGWRSKLPWGHFGRCFSLPKKRGWRNPPAPLFFWNQDVRQIRRHLCLLKPRTRKGTLIVAAFISSRFSWCTIVPGEYILVSNLGEIHLAR